MDEATVSSIINGSENGFRQLFDQFHAKLYYYFLQKTGSADISEELVQLTFIKCWRFRSGLDPELPISRQLFKIAKTVLIDLLRQRAASRTVSLEAIAPPSLSEEPSVLQKENDPLLILQESLSQLPPERRKIITYRLRGLSNKEIAEQLRISKKTVENQVNRALREIRRFSVELSLLSYMILFLKDRT